MGQIVQHRYPGPLKRLLAIVVLFVAGTAAPAFADLHIKSVERGDGEAPVSRGQTVDLRVTVVNSGRVDEFLRITQVGGCAAGQFFNIGDEEFVKGGDEKEIAFPLCINQEAITGRLTPAARFSTLIFLGNTLDGRVPFSGVSDNRRDVEFPAVRLRNVTVRLDRLVVRDDMDNVSPGDWHVVFDVANFAGAPPGPRYGRQTSGPPFPDATGTRDVDSDTTVGIRRSVSVFIAQSEPLVVNVFAIDCDGDLGFTTYIQRLGGQLSCNNQEEIFETSGDHDLAGPAVVQLSPAQWLRGGSFTSRPVLEFTATISVMVAP
jgi:hypothetical protein